VRRGPISATYYSRFVLIGSMNPEEGKLRAQILDRFGLRVIVQGLENAEERLNAYQKVQAYRANPRHVVMQFMEETSVVREEIKAARQRVHHVTIPHEIAKPAIELVQAMGIDSLRAEITWFESAKAYASADNRSTVTLEDLKAVAPMALRMRRSEYIINYFKSQKSEETEMATLLKAWAKGKNTKAPKPKNKAKKK
jgi:magnesium chelatase subunit I